MTVRFGRFLFALAALLGVQGAARGEDVLYGGNGGHSNASSTNDGSLLIIDQVTAAVTVIGHPEGVGRLSGIAFAPSGVLYATTLNAGGFPLSGSAQSERPRHTRPGHGRARVDDRADRVSARRARDEHFGHLLPARHRRAVRDPRAGGRHAVRRLSLHNRHGDRRRDCGGQHGGVLHHDHVRAGRHPLRIGGATGALGADRPRDSHVEPFQRRRVELGPVAVSHGGRWRFAPTAPSSRARETVTRSTRSTRRPASPR